MPRVVFTPTGMSDKLLGYLRNDLAVLEMLQAIPDDVVNVVVCLDGKSPHERTLRSGEHDGMDRMLTSFLRPLNKAVNVSLFSFEDPQQICEQHLERAHIFWQGGSGGGDSSLLMRAMMQNGLVRKILQYKVCTNQIIYIGVCVGAMIAGAEYGGWVRRDLNRLDVDACLWRFFAAFFIYFLWFSTFVVVFVFLCFLIF